MKIIFATNQDESTEVSYRTIEKLISNISSGTFCSLLNMQATHNELHKTLVAESKYALFVTGHGKDAYIIDQNGEVALDKIRLPLLKDRHIFAFCCWTANELGKEIQKQTSASYWGYSGQLILHDYEELDELMTSLVAYLYENFDLYTGKEEIILFLSSLKEKCEQAYEEILEKYADDWQNYALPFAAGRAFGCVWKRLRVFIADVSESIKHEEAEEDTLY
jgi:hypothetical protein